MRKMNRFCPMLLCFLSVFVMKAGNPLRFKENKGQVSDQNFKPRPDILYSANDGKVTYHFRQNGLSYQLNKVSRWQKPDKEKLPPVMAKRMGDSSIAELTFYRIDINWINSNTSLIEKGIAEEGYDNYYLEVCPDGALGVKSYKDITYKNLYKGIDVKWYEKNGSLKYDYIVSPGSDYKQIQFEINGAEKIYLNKNGELVIKTPLGEIVEQKPYVTQNGKILEAKWKIKKNIVSFEIKGVDPNQKLIIDPLVRLWGSYHGGNFSDEGWLGHFDLSGNSYISGETKSTIATNVATNGAFQTIYGGGTQWGDAFIAKFNPLGQRLWATYCGGSGADFANSSTTDSNGNVYLTGGTSATLSSIIATPGTHQYLPSGGGSGLAIDDAFVIKFDPSGVRVWGTFYGGNSFDFSYSINTNSFGDVLVSGASQSTDLNTIASPGAFQTTYGGGGRDMFLVKFNSNGQRTWGTYYGNSSSWEDALACGFDQFGNIYLAGTAGNSTGTVLTTPGSHQSVYGGGTTDAIIVKFDSFGNRIWSTYYGGTNSDVICDLNIKGSFLYAAGYSSSNGNIASIASHQSAAGGGNDAFLLKMNLTGVRIWATYYGGLGTEDWATVSIDNNDDLYLGGTTTSSTGTVIATQCTYQDFFGGIKDGFIAKFNNNGQRLWGTYYGGQLNENWVSCDVDAFNNILLSGTTSTSTGTMITTANSAQPAFGGGPFDAFLVKFSPCLPAMLPNTTPPPDMSICIGENTSLTTSLTSCGIQWMDTPNGNVIGTNSVFITPTLSANSTFYVQDISCGPGGSLTAIEVTVHPLPIVSLTSSDSLICSGSTTTLNASGATNYTWQPAMGNASVAIASPVSNTSYSVFGDDGFCTNSAVITISTVAIPALLIQYPFNPQCNGSTITLSASGAQDFVWSPSSLLNSSFGSSVTTMPLINATSFSVTGINSIGTVSCSTTTSFNISVLQPLIVTVSPSVEICEGSQAALYANGGNTWVWSGTNIDDPFSQGTLVTPLSSGIYSVEASYNYVCPVTATVFVKVNPKPNLFAGNDTTITIGDYATIHAQSNGEAKWITGDNISCKECASSVVYPYTKTCYIAEAFSDKGCRAQDEVCVDVNNDYNIYIPNTFTPDGDGLNDVFSVHGYGIKEFNLSIYNRWGDLLYSNESSQGWDGKFKGTICEDGVYIYKTDITPIKGKLQQRAGHVTLLKSK